MLRHFLMIAALLIAAPAQAEIAARSTAQLKAVPMVAGETITLGDIFDGAGDAASVKVVDAPRPGQKLAIEARSLAALAVEHGLLWTNYGGLANVEVARAGREVNAQAIGDAVSKALNLAAGGRDLDARILQSGLSLIASVEDASEPQVKILALDEQTGRFQAQVSVPGGNGALVNGMADEVMSVPVLARPLQRGEVVKEADIAWVRLRIEAIGRQIVTDPTAIVGLSARRPLRSGQPLITGDVERPNVVVKGAHLTMSFKMPGMTLTDSGRALENGAVGDLINVMNERSHRTVQARVVSADAVELSPSPPLAPRAQASLER